MPDAPRAPAPDGNANPRPGTAVTVRGLAWSDFDELVSTYYHLYEERDSGRPIGITLFADRPSRSDEVDWFARLYGRVLAGSTVASVAEADGRAVGICTIAPVGSGPGSETGHVGELGLLVRERDRGKGVGAALLEHALRAARDRFELVRLSVFANNARAIRLYERFGFGTVGRLPAAVRRGTEYFDELLMVRDLRPSPAKS